MQSDSKPGDEVRVHLIWGEDELMVDGKSRELVERLCPAQEQKFGLDIIDGEAGNSDAAVAAVNQTLSALRTIGFLSDGKTVWLRGADFLDTGIVAKSQAVKAAMDRLTETIKSGIPSDCRLVITSPKVFRGSGFYKACATNGKVQEFGIATSAKDKNTDSIEFAKGLIKSEQINMRDDALHVFISRCGSEKRQIVQEVAKLAAYQNADVPINVDDVITMTTASPESEYWELADAVGKRDMGRALKILDKQIRQGGSAIGMVAGIEKKFQQLLILRDMLRLKWISYDRRSAAWNGNPEAERRIDAVIDDKRQDPRKMHPYRLMMLCRDAMNYSRAELIQALKHALKTHETMVSAMIPQAAMVELLILKTAGRRDKRKS